MLHPLLFKKLASHPLDVTQPWSDEVQGITHDEDHWYLGQTSRLWKIPVGLDLAAALTADLPPAGVLSVPLAGLGLDDFNHMGDLDWYDGRLFVALEPREGVNRGSRVMVFDAGDLRFIASAELPGQGGHAPWCAVRPADGLLYSSSFNGVDRLHAYAFALTNGGLTLRHEHDLPLRHKNGKPFTLREVQGGAFSPDSTIYLSSNADRLVTGGPSGAGFPVASLPAQRGVHVFRADGLHLKALRIDTELGTVGEEIEGLCYWALDTGTAPGISGQLHVVELDNDWPSRDELKALHHYRIEQSRFVANLNPSSREVHRWDCVWVGKMLASHKRPYARLARALADGYDGCNHCLPEHNTR